MGVERISLAIYDDPGWIEDMMEHLCQLSYSVIEKIAGKARVDVGRWWEDMCYRSGPLLSPEHFAKWMVPRYRRVMGLLRDGCGCEFGMVDCDGRINELAPLWLEGGVNVFWPMEVCSDAFSIRRELGTNVAFRGYVDKRALIAGKAAIDKELGRIAPLLEGGGFIPHVDHHVPPDVAWDDFCYYHKCKCELIGKPSRW